jgi:two-component system sensor histidine kinase UhpB
MSLKLRLVGAIFLVLLLGSLAGICVAGWRARTALKDELDSAMQGGRQTVASAFEDLPRSDHPARDLRQLVGAFDGARHLAAVWRGADGALRLASRPTTASPAPRLFAQWLAPPMTSETIAIPVAGYGAMELTPIAAVDVGALWTEFVGLALALAASLAAAAAAAWLVVGRALRPLALFSAAFDRIGRGDYGAAAPEGGPSELARLGRAVNLMARRLGDMRETTRALEEQLCTLQDEERADLARDLHDEIGPHLFAVGADAATGRRLVADGAGPEAAERLAAIEASARHMQGLVRDILTRLRPTEIFELGLAPAIAEVVAFWRARRPQICFHVEAPDDEAAVAPAYRETVYRLVQESLANAVRHASPERIDVVVRAQADGGVLVSVADDGRAGTAEGSGFGLTGMRERVTALGGRLEIAQGDDKGWTVLARLPAPASSAA